MIDWVTWIYLGYSFVSYYFLFLFILVYFENRKNFFHYPRTQKKYGLSVIIPCYNEEKNIGKTIESLINSDYPYLEKIIVVDDCSKDRSFEIAKEYEKKYPSKVLAVQTPKNSGKASGSKNYGVKFADSELIGFVDSDSYPEKDAISKMVGFFDDSKVAAVTSTVLVQNRKNWIEILQSIEYIVIAFSRKLLGFLDAIYVTPGPLALYRKKYFDEVGGFDETNLTEDIEITWNFISKGYIIEMSAQSKVYSVAPSKFKHWFKQRIRWNLGGLQTISKYKKSISKRGILGWFILPFFVMSWFIGLFGLGFLIYRYSQRFFVQYLSTKYSIDAQVAVLTFRDLNLTPNLLVFLGLLLLFLSFVFNFFALYYYKEREFKKPNFLMVLLYMFVYLLAYPPLLIVSGYKYLTGKRTW